MTVFNLDKFPHVCRLCMKPETEEMHSVEESWEVLSPIGDFLDLITFRVNGNKSKFIPSKVCRPCLKELGDFARYRDKLALALRFMEAMVDLKESNSEPLSRLFRENRNELNRLFKDLALCNKEDPLFDDLIGEFDSYNIASNEIVKKEEVEEQSDHDYDAEYECANSNDENADQDMEPQTLLYVDPSLEDLSEPSDDKEKETKKTKKKERVKGRPKGTKDKDTTGTKKRGRPRIYPNGSILEEPWSCDKCKFTTKYRTAIERHKGVHIKRETRTYPCADCDQVFKNYEAMRTHSMTHPENQAVCEICGISLKNTYSLKAHMERHDDKKYSCDYCDYTTNTNLSLKSHLMLHTKTKWNKNCEICGMSFRTASRLKRHMEAHNNERKYACEQCPARFNTPNAMRNHRTRVHVAIRFPCEHCDKTYDQKIALRDHVERIHHIQCNFICDICVATYDSQERLDAHKYRHENPKPMECAVCLTLHVSQEEFDGHMCITYRDDYMCCNKDLRNHVQFNKHMTVKHGMKTNFRVKPVPGVLLGQLRGARKRLEQCRRCDIAFPSRALKLQHLAVCNLSEIPIGHQVVIDNNM